MIIHTYGSILIIVVFLSFLTAWRTYLKKNLNATLYLILLAGLILRIYISADPFLHEWDEKYHALVAKHMIDHPLKPTLYENPVLPFDAHQWTGNHVWLEKGPVPLLCIATSLKLFGLSPFSVRIPSILVGTLAILLTYFIGLWLYNKRIGLLAAFFHSINGLILELSGGRISSDHIESFFIFFVELGFFFVVYFMAKNAQKWVSMLIGLCVALAILSKWFPALLVFPVWTVALFVSKKLPLKSQLIHIGISLATCFLVVFPYFFFIAQTYPVEFDIVFNKFIFAYSEVIEDHSAPWYYYINKIGIVFGEGALLGILLYSYNVFKSNRKWQAYFLQLWWLIPVLIFSTAETKRATYILISAPAIMIVISVAFFYLKEMELKKNLSWFRYLLLFAFIALPIRYTFERVKFFDNRELNPRYINSPKDFALLNYDPQNTIIFNVEYAIEAMFFSDFTVYSRSPTEEEIKHLQNENMSILVYNRTEKLFEEAIEKQAK